MRKLLVILALCAAPAAAQPPGIWWSGGGSGSGGGTWGSITGTLSDQTDLNTALGTKLPEPASSGYVVRTGAGASAARTFASLTGTITVTNADGTAGNTSFDVATSVIPSYATGTSLPATCTAFAQMFGRTDTHLGYLCTNTNTWTMFNDATALQGTVPVASGGTNLTASADDNVMVGNGTTWETKAVPDCDDSGGNHLNYDTGTNAFSCGTSSSGGGGLGFVFWGNDDQGTIAATTTAYLGPALTSQTSEARRSWFVPATCTARNLYVTTSTSQGAGGTLVFTVRDVTAASDTAVVVTISAGSGAGTYSNTSDTGSITGGHAVVLKVVNNHSSGSAGIGAWGFQCN